MKRNEALKILSAHRSEFARFKVKSLSIFGSVARDQAREDSDVDLLVEFLDFKEFLEGILKARVDLATERTLKKQLREQILKEAIRAA